MKKYLLSICCLICCQCMVAMANVLPTDKDTIVYDTIAWQPTYEFVGHILYLDSYKDFPDEDSIEYIFEYRYEEPCVKHKLSLCVLSPNDSDTLVVDCDSIAVDLGLSVKWASYNIGATKPEEYGDYFAWGEVVPKESYDWDTYKFGASNQLTKYCSDSEYGKDGFKDDKTVLDPEDDAAVVNWGGSWRMPTDEEMTELREQCTWTWITQNGVNGYKVVGPNGNSIFLPAAGFMNESGFNSAASDGDYWSSSLNTSDPNHAYYVNFNSSNVIRYDCFNRYTGRSVRPVCVKEQEQIQSYEFVEKDTICGNELPYIWRGKECSATGVYYDSLKTVLGGDSVYVLELTVLPQLIGETENKTIRLGETYTWHGKSYTTTGIYNDTLESTFGCDSIVTLNLVVLQPVYGAEVSASICEGECYTWQGAPYSVAGTYRDTLSGVSGCDSIVTLHLTVNKSVTTEITHVACDTYTWNGKTYTTTGDYTHTTTGSNGCDSTTILHLRINYRDTAYFTATACDVYEWHGEKYTTSGIYYYNTTTVLGCDSIEELTLTVNYSDTVEITEVACVDYTWTNGETYIESGIYYDSLTTAHGCDSIRILYLTILPTYYFEDTAVILEDDIYQWRGKNYSEEGIYFDSLLTEAGCDSVYSLILEVEEKVILHEINIAEQCAGSGVMDVELLIQSGIADTIVFEFSQSALDAGFVNTALPYDEVMQLAYHDIRAGKYGVKLSGRYRGLVVFEQQVELTLLYPTTVMRKLWDDVLAVLTHDYNGGYNFVAFQWYKNGEMIPGATHSYINDLLVIGTEYSVLLTEDNGLKLMTCPLVIDERVGISDIEEQVDISLYPTLLIGTQNVTCKVSESATVYIYDMMGNLISEFKLEAGESEIETPYVAGAYMAKIVTITNKVKNIKLVVQ